MLGAGDAAVAVVSVGATQFHDLIAATLRMLATPPILVVPAGWSFQPVDVRETAKPAYADGRAAAALELWEQLQGEIAGLSTDSRLLVAERAGHQVHRDDPRLIVRVVTDIVRRHRDQPIERAVVIRRPPADPRPESGGSGAAL